MVNYNGNLVILSFIISKIISGNKSISMERLVTNIIKFTD